ncbi:hypothetical protein BYT27DRAFT_7123920 [Phlegmacium glaucopus]|nr:hypothetical protein BYT27DRAFT_7123920 [Phlegmacium glaucopus]
MQRSYPIPMNPEFSILESPGFREYRVEKRRKKYSSILFPLFFSLAVALCWQTVTSWFMARLESVVILGPHGIQLETHRGFLIRLPWLTNRRFIASTHLHGVYISEGLKGWNVRFYLVAIKRTALPGSTFEVAYQNFLPDQTILQYVYQGVHEILLSSPTTNTPETNIHALL